MALVSEQSMLKATVLELSHHEQQSVEELELARLNVQNGRCPNEETMRTWERARREPAAVVEEPANQQRVNSYIPDDDMGLPQPFGGQAPFQPTKKGSTMRHIRKPIPKDIEI